MTHSRRAHHSLHRTLLAMLVLGLTAGCAYRADVQQGNFLDETSVGQVEVGMTRSQVQFLLGTPMVADVFHQDRWDYVYYLKFGKSRDVIRRHFVIYFDDDTVSRVERRDAG